MQAAAGVGRCPAVRVAPTPGRFDMRAFAELYSRLDETTRTNEKVDALTAYFAGAPAGDAAWALYFLIGRKIKQLVPTKLLRAWVSEEAGVPDWLFQESYDAVGDLAETIALLLPEGRRDSLEQEDLPLQGWVESRLLPLKGMSEAEQRMAMLDAWRQLDRQERFVWNKLISGGFRVGVSQQLVTRAIGRVNGVDPAVVAHRLMGDWEPGEAFFTALVSVDASDADHSRPYPFCLAHPIEMGESDTLQSLLGDRSEWLAEWKWDGIRTQVIRRQGETFIWTRGEELVTERYPELGTLAAHLPDGTVLDGEILPWKDGFPLPFAQMQRRIGRKTVSKAILNEVPVILVAFDVLEFGGDDVRSRPLDERRKVLEELVDRINLPERLRASPRVVGETWEDLTEARLTSREVQAEGIMLKRRDSIYQVGRKRGDWWKWKVTPFTVDAVLTAAQRGSGKRASLYTDYTFCVWDRPSDQEGARLVPIAKAYSGLTDEEIRKVDNFVRKNMLEKFGPVRTVTPELVFELAFEGIQLSPRHKSGIAVRFPRILRWRTDKKPADADNLETLKELLK